MSRARINADQAHTESLSVVPHIIPDVLYPAYEADATGAGKLLDGTTEHGTGTYGGSSVSTSYGTVQTDGRKYYFTNIAGSKPIKDPRIGSHFGSQRYKFKSLQLLEQETATHGSNVYSVDGREWLRYAAVGGATITVANNNRGNFLDIPNTFTSAFFEVVCYCSGANLLNHTAGNGSSYRAFKIAVDGGSDSGHIPSTATGVDTPLQFRYVDSGSVINTEISPALGIHTLRIKSSGAYDMKVYGIELIAQDTSNRNKIQIPSQNVVSYGKKFTVSGTPHYNPFAFKTDGSTAWASGAHNGTAWPIGTGSSTNIDTATSLGLAAWVSTNYYKPYNGGRVVKWIASDGTIKTSVNMMPPNARNISSTASNEKGDDSGGTTSAAVANTQFLPTFTDQAIDHSLAEVAKTFHFREFGNGSANGGTGSGTYPDASMLNTADDIAYVMDDGLTSLSGDDVTVGSNVRFYAAANKAYYITFIGTGFAFTIDSGAGGAGTHYVAQNLPYGTHIIKQYRDGSNADPHITVDGVQFSSVNIDSYTNLVEVFFYQPKMPPIPEDAVVIADYMLMADFVAQTAAGVGTISKGVRYVAASRDMFYDRTVAGTQQTNPFQSGDAGMFGGGYYVGNAVGTETRSLPVFGDSFIMYFRSNTDINSTSIPITAGSAGTTALNNWTVTGVGAGVSSISAAGGLVQAATSSFGNVITAKAGASVDLGVQILKSVGTIATSQYNYLRGYGIHTPIHTSSHYQTFETPFLHELVGGDRNMEQTNLVVTPDGKTWDEVTRDVSYIGDTVMQLSADGGGSGYNVALAFDECRGFSGTQTDKFINTFNKDFAIAHDRQICLVDGEYSFHVSSRVRESGTSGKLRLRVNGNLVTEASVDDGTWTHVSISAIIQLKRGDYIQVLGGYWEPDYTINNDYYVRRLK